MLKRIKIQGFKSLADVEVNLEFLSVLIGPNASGKSNFLDALHLLSRIATSRTLREAFAPPYRGKPLESFTFGKGGVASLLEQEKVSFRMEVDVQLSPSVIASVNQQIQAMNGTPAPKKNVGSPLPLVREKNLRYCIEVEMLPAQGILRVADESLVALTTKGKRKRNRKPFIERVEDWVHLRMEGQPRPLCYERYLEQSILSERLHPSLHPHAVAMQEELARWATFYFEPRERMRVSTPVTEVHHIGLMGENLAALLNTLQALNEQQFQYLEKELEAVIPAITGIDVSVNSVGDVELNLQEGEKLVSSRVVSEGTLRALGLLALRDVKGETTLVGLEEPENGIHPRRISLVAEILDNRRLMEDTQFIVTTHSPLLLEFIRPEFFYVCRQVDGVTVIEPFITRMKSLWPKLDIKEALEDLDEMSIPKRMLRGDLHV
ncbi:recombinase RecF [Candidatus Poribacteria bacterium]|nr:MAG: recombinase RecF [Candidatus Poribacteria bacterium]